jgi:hypothetical protein
MAARTASSGSAPSPAARRPLASQAMVSSNAYQTTPGFDPK